MDVIFGGQMLCVRASTLASKSKLKLGTCTHADASTVFSLTPLSLAKTNNDDDFDMIAQL
jgi:hypothetical protein